VQAGHSHLPVVKLRAWFEMTYAARDLKCPFIVSWATSSLSNDGTEEAQLEKVRTKVRTEQDQAPKAK
jgi:hypothetical protein